ncbi:hypothetical protein L228DRAFT_257931 [Xylona heveae TC161]|uniref:Uncharacterized protein n=1 Tax=Xylona heveae (strain CBS 132557 / TC161) TaxID=1328760 RepID=A0A165JQD1_XYLHT|nr:hypothetical protein L228DRAFT_257931 [Xylona heveae TC161]KZF26509.1 hypothetical protein L228DRAFT_257931 [Xylona heveae TC161]
MGQSQSKRRSDVSMQNLRASASSGTPLNSSTPNSSGDFDLTPASSAQPYGDSATPSRVIPLNRLSSLIDPLEIVGPVRSLSDDEDEDGVVWVSDDAWEEETMVCSPSGQRLMAPEDYFASPERPLSLRERQEKIKNKMLAKGSSANHLDPGTSSQSPAGELDLSEAQAEEQLQDQSDDEDEQTSAVGAPAEANNNKLRLFSCCFGSAME